MKHLTSLLAGAAFVMAAAGLALSVRNYLSEQDEWELFDDECDEGDDLCFEPEEAAADEAPEEETPAEEDAAQD